MSERPCIRGCTQKGEHFAACASYGKDDGDCRGCVPVAARDGALICERCYRRLRRHLEDAADLVGHLRSMADPMKAAVYDKVMVSASKPEAPAPVAADLVDAADHIVRTLRAWALFVQFGEGHPWRAQGLEAGIDAESAFEDANGCAEVILEELDRLANDSHQIPALCEGVLDMHGREPAYWTIADALARYPLNDRPRWAMAPCPSCDLKTVRVIPPRRRGQSFRYLCRECGWEANDRDDDGLWGDVFAEHVEAA